MLDRKLIGELHHIHAEAYGPVVLRPKGSTWRSQKSEGGGCLFDYSCHAIDLMNYLMGRPMAVSGSVLNRVFSNDVDDEIYATFQFGNGIFGQLATNWSDESYRKMSVKLSIWGKNGRINVDRQELQVYIRSLPEPIDGFSPGWNVRYTTELTPPVWFYVRGEEYSAQIDHFVQCIKTGTSARSNFRTASDASLVVAMMRADAAKPRTTVALGVGGPECGEVQRSSSLHARLYARHLDSTIEFRPMNSALMDRVLFGDNQFFGVNHMSEEKARQQAMRFQKIAAVIDVLDDAYAEGIKTFMCTTHERISEVCDHFRVNREKYPDYKFYPCLPYAHK